MVGTIRFELRADVKGKGSKQPINMIYSLHGKRSRFSTGLTIYKDYWDKPAQRVMFIPAKRAKQLLPELPSHALMSEIDVKEANDALNVLSARTGSIENKFIANGVLFTSEMVRERLSTGIETITKREEHKNFLFDFMDKYVQDHEATRAKGSLSVYKSVMNHLQAYQDETSDKVKFETIDYAFFQRFQTFLINRTKTDKAGKIRPMLNNTTIAKALSTLKTFLNYAKQQGIKVNETYSSFAIKKEKLEVIALTSEELDALLSLDLTNNKRLDKARDVFCFSCATGLRYSDVAQITWEQIKGDCIELVVKKTKSELTIPLNQLSWAILDKYRSLHTPLPKISNQNLNYYVKEVCQLADISELIEIVRYRGAERETVTSPKYELITFHVGRKTFCTLSLEKGMSAEEVMSISGHTDYKSFQRYVNVTYKRKKVVMVKAWGEVPILKSVS